MDTPLLNLFCHHYGIDRQTPKPSLLVEILRRFSAIPYENLSKIVRTHEGLSANLFQPPEEVLRNHWKYGAGGTCFPLTETLTQLLQEAGFNAAPILADRRYGTDTHCAVLLELNEVAHVIDPGYLIFSPIALPTTGSIEHSTPFTTLVFTALAAGNRVDLATRDAGTVRYRLTYKTTPVDDETFKSAWKRSFEWEMMTYPVISSITGDAQLYIQKSSLVVKTKGRSTRTTVSDEQLVSEVSVRLSMSPELVRKALSYLKN